MIFKISIFNHGVHNFSGGLQVQVVEDYSKVSDDARNGLITAIGIILGFSLTFLAQWSLDDSDWELRDLLPMVVLLAGVSMMLAALKRALIPYHQNIPHYEKTVQLFFWSIVVVLFGFVVSIFS